MLLDHKIDDIRILQRQAMLGSINRHNFYWWTNQTRRRVEEVTNPDSILRSRYLSFIRTVEVNAGDDLRSDLMSATDILEELVEALHAMSTRDYMVTARYESNGQMNDNMIEPELWLEIYKLVESQDWSKLTASVGLFFEDRLRKWTVDPNDETCQALHSTKLIKAVLGEDGSYRLGSNESERRGWLELALGFYTAVRNVGNHRMHERSDAQIHAIGVLATASLILSGLRSEYGPGNLWSQGVPKIGGTTHKH